MRGADERSGSMFSYVSLEERVPQDHPLRAIRRITDRALERLSLRDGSRKTLTSDRAEHAASFSRDGALYVDSRTSASTWPESVVVRAGGQTLGRLPDAAEAPPFRVNLELTTAGPFPADATRGDRACRTR